MHERREGGERGIEHLSSLERQGSKARRGIGEDERIASFGCAIDALRREIEAELGEPDLAHIRRIASLSRRLEVLGRGLLHVSFEPVTFGLGVCALWLHKQLEASEIGHTVLHGAYDRIPGADEFRVEASGGGSRSMRRTGEPCTTFAIISIRISQGETRTCSSGSCG